MAIELSSAGVKLGWAMETTTGKRPETGYVRVRGVKSIPSFNPEPDTLEVTDLNDMEFKRYIDALKDTGGALPFTCNLTEELIKDWDDGIMVAYNAGKVNELQMWFHINIPGLTKGFFFRGNPSALGMPLAAVNSVLEIDVYITPTLVEGWATKSTVAEPVAG